MTDLEKKLFKLYKKSEPDLSREAVEEAVTNTIESFQDTKLETDELLKFLKDHTKIYPSLKIEDRRNIIIDLIETLKNTKFEFEDAEKLTHLYNTICSEKNVFEMSEAIKDSLKTAEENKISIDDILIIGRAYEQSSENIKVNQLSDAITELTTYSIKSGFKTEHVEELINTHSSIYPNSKVPLRTSSILQILEVAKNTKLPTSSAEKLMKAYFSSAYQNKNLANMQLVLKETIKALSKTKLDDGIAEAIIRAYKTGVGDPSRIDLNMLKDVVIETINFLNNSEGNKVSDIEELISTHSEFYSSSDLNFIKDHVLKLLNYAQENEVGVEDIKTLMKTFMRHSNQNRQATALNSAVKDTLKVLKSEENNFDLEDTISLIKKYGNISNNIDLPTLKDVVTETVTFLKKSRFDINDFEIMHDTIQELYGTYKTVAQKEYILDFLKSAELTEEAIYDTINLMQTYYKLSTQNRNIDYAKRAVRDTVNFIKKSKESHVYEIISLAQAYRNSAQDREVSMTDLKNCALDTLKFLENHKFSISDAEQIIQADFEKLGSSNINARKDRILNFLSCLKGKKLRINDLIRITNCYYKNHLSNKQNMPNAVKATIECLERNKTSVEEFLIINKALDETLQKNSNSINLLTFKDHITGVIDSAKDNNITYSEALELIIDETTYTSNPDLLTSSVIDKIRILGSVNNKNQKFSVEDVKKLTEAYSKLSGDTTSRKYALMHTLESLEKTNLNVDDALLLIGEYAKFKRPNLQALKSAVTETLEAIQKTEYTINDVLAQMYNHKKPSETELLTIKNEIRKELVEEQKFLNNHQQAYQKNPGTFKKYFQKISEEKQKKILNEVLGMEEATNKEINDWLTKNYPTMIEYVGSERINPEVEK